MAQCVLCGSEISPVISFGQQPIANGFLSEKEFADEYFFELALCFCPNCSMAQLAEQPDPEQMFNENYAFFSGTSRMMGIHFGKFAKQIMQDYLPSDDPFVVEIGSNDGIMLINFKEAGIRHLGVEPSANVAEAALKKGIQTLVRFFDAETATQIVEEHGQADAFMAANVMCHIPTLHKILAGVEVLLKPGGVVAFEDPYLGDVIEKTSYDQIYDEHMFLFSATSIRNLFRGHGFDLIDVQPQETHGGSMRYFLAHEGARQPSPRVNELLEKEARIGLADPETFRRFKENCEQSRQELASLLKKLKAENKRVVGYAATSKSTTVINYCGLTPDLIEFISDTTPIKQGKFSPGKHIPVLPHEKFKADFPDYALLFGWNHRKEITANEQEFLAQGGQWIVYVPRVEIVQ